MALIAMITTAIVAVPASAHADTGPVFDLSSDANPLLAGSLGAIAIDPADTAPYRGSGPCPTEHDPDGYAAGAVYTVQTASAARLDATVTDDLDASLSLCLVALYEHARGGVTFSDPFDATERAALEVLTAGDCASASSCSLDLMLDPDSTYHLVVFAATPPSGSPDARFSISGSVRRPVSLRLTASGHRIRDRCYGYLEVIRGRRLSVRVRTTPEIDGLLRVRTYRFRGGRWEQLTSSTATLTAGSATVAPRAAGSSKRRIAVWFLGTEQEYGASGRQLRYRAVQPRWRRYADGGALLAVPYHRQQHRLSCEAATLRMAHNYHHPGRIDRDMAVYKITGIEKNRRPARARGCNPDRAFCGRVNGWMMRDGYGVHAGPIARAATHYDRCRPALHLRDYSYATLARHINDGYPVIVWGAHRGASGIYRYRWRSWDGNRITAYSVEHVWVVHGFRGSVSNPRTFVIHDPSRGKSRTVTRSQLRAFTTYFETAVVVRG